MEKLKKAFEDCGFQIIPEQYNESIGTGLSELCVHKDGCIFEISTTLIVDDLADHLKTLDSVETLCVDIESNNTNVFDFHYYKEKRSGFNSR